MVLDDIADDSVLVKVPPAALCPEVLAEDDLEVEVQVAGQSNSRIGDREQVRCRASDIDVISTTDCVHTHLYAPDELPVPQGLKDEVREPKHGKVLNQLLACGKHAGVDSDQIWVLKKHQSADKVIVVYGMV